MFAGCLLGKSLKETYLLLELRLSFQLGRVVGLQHELGRVVERQPSLGMDDQLKNKNSDKIAKNSNKKIKSRLVFTWHMHWVGLWNGNFNWIWSIDYKTEKSFSLTFFPDLNFGYNHLCHLPGTWTGYGSFLTI